MGELADAVYRIIYKLVKPSWTMYNLHTRRVAKVEAHRRHLIENTECDCERAFGEVKVVFELYEDGSFSIMSCSDLEELCSKIYSIIHKLLSPHARPDSIYMRREAALETYRRQYEMNHPGQIQRVFDPDEGEDEIDG
jgi:hypothetical protein